VLSHSVGDIAYPDRVNGIVPTFTKNIARKAGAVKSARRLQLIEGCYIVCSLPDWPLYLFIEISRLLSPRNTRKDARKVCDSEPVIKSFVVFLGQQTKLSEAYWRWYNRLKRRAIMEYVPLSYTVFIDVTYVILTT
jgi:hypothetical protein